MRSTAPALRSIVLPLSSLLLSCLPEGGTSRSLDVHAEEAPRRGLERLAAETRSAWRVRYHAGTSTAAFLEGKAELPMRAESLHVTVRSLLLRYASLFGLSRRDELYHVGTSADTLGMRHIRFVQRRQGVSVQGSALLAHIGPRGDLLRVSARTYRLAGEGALRPVLSGAAAQQRALVALRAEREGAALGARAPSLVMLPIDAAGRLAYRVEVEGQDGHLPIARGVFIDAETGAVLRQDDLVSHLNLPRPVEGSGAGVLGQRRSLSVTLRGETYYLEDMRRGGSKVSALGKGERLPGSTLKSRRPDEWTDVDSPPGLAVDLHAHLATLWDHFAKHHQRFGPEGDGKGLVAVTHLQVGPSIGLFDGRRLLFGAGDGVALLPPGAALDVVAHEYMHAVTRSVARLSPHGESAELDEAIADLFACLVEQAEEPSRGNWTIGETIWIPGGKPTPLRDLSDPRRTDQAGDLAGYMRGDRDPSTPDQKALHVNAGIIGHAGYLLAQRIGNMKAAAIWYRALSLYLREEARFLDAADAVRAAALDLHGGESLEAREAARSFAAVGIGNIESIGESAAP